MSGYRGIIINKTDTLARWGLILGANYVIERPQKKELWQDIPGANGALDYSEALTGYPVYNMRTLSLPLVCGRNDASLEDAYEELQNLHAGTTAKITVPWDMEHYYLGTLRVGQMQNYNGGTIPLTLYAQPYRLQILSTVLKRNISTTPSTIILKNEQMPVIPTITVSTATTITFEGTTYNVAAGTVRLVNILLKEGNNLFTVATGAGTGTITFSYQEGAL